MLPRNWEIETEPGGYTEWGWIDWGFKTYYAFLNCGFRMRPTAGTARRCASRASRLRPRLCTSSRQFSDHKWIEGLDAGRQSSFVTTGPMLMLQFNGRRAGTVFKDTSEAVITGTAESRLPLHRIEIIVDRPRGPHAYSGQQADKSRWLQQRACRNFAVRDFLVGRGPLL